MVVWYRYDVIHEIRAADVFDTAGATETIVAVPPRKRQRLHHAQTWSAEGGNSHGEH